MIIWRAILIILIMIFYRFDRSGADSFFSFLFFRSFLRLAFAGAALTVLGLIIAIWARISLGSNWSNYVTYKKEHELITTGPYKLLRHPIYSGIILMLTGTFLYYGSLIVLLILAIATVFITRRMEPEEKIMINLFGKKYTDYMERTERLIPWIY